MTQVVGPDPTALIQIRDRLAAHAEGPAPTTRWCVCLNLHYQIGITPPAGRAPILLCVL